MMLGASRAALAAARDDLAGRADDPAFPGLSQELLDVAHLLGREPQLRSALTDPGDTGERRAALARELFGNRISPVAVAVVSSLAARRWSAPRDLVDATEALAAEAAFTVAEREGRLDAVEDELFRFGRTVEGSPRLRATLTDPAVPDADKAAVVGSLLAGKASDETTRLARYVAAHPRGRRLEDAIGELVQAASIRRQRLVAEVTVAVPLTDEQRDRLGAALSRIYGRVVDLQVSIDPEVRGGVSVRVGDELIDGTVAHRLAEARRSFGL
jgi:F-type H+-transporting ATPase subunit delta